LKRQHAQYRPYAFGQEWFERSIGVHFASLWCFVMTCHMTVGFTRAADA
jgi:hypothetical protein